LKTAKGTGLSGGGLEGKSAPRVLIAKKQKINTYWPGKTAQDRSGDKENEQGERNPTPLQNHEGKAVPVKRKQTFRTVEKNRF